MPKSDVLARLKSGRRIPVAVLVDVDGTLAGIYRQGKRKLRPSALEALALLSEVAPVFLWSIVGSENGERLQREFPEIRPFVTGSFGKSRFPLELVDRAYAIDDDALDQPVLRCRHVILEHTYSGGRDTDELLRVVERIASEIRAEAQPASAERTSKRPSRRRRSTRARQ